LTITIASQKSANEIVLVKDQSKIHFGSHVRNTFIGIEGCSTDLQQTLKIFRVNVDQQKWSLFKLIQVTETCSLDTTYKLEYCEKYQEIKICATVLNCYIIRNQLVVSYSFFFSSVLFQGNHNTTCGTHFFSFL
jgi:hypothetical protein